MRKTPVVPWRGLWVTAGLLGAVIIVPVPGPAVAQQGTAVTAAAVGPHWSVTLGPAVAQRKGYWRAEGLDVKFTIVGPATTHVAALAGGSIQFSINLTTDTMARAAGAGARIYAIMGSTNQNPYALFGRPNVKALQDLKGKRIAIDSPGGPIDIFVREILSSEKMSARDVTLIPVQGTITERINAMLSGAADAGMGTMSDWPTLRTQGMHLLYKLSTLYPDWQFAVMGTTAGMLDKNPPAVKAFIKGFIRTFQFMKDPRNEAELLRIAREARLEVDERQWPELLALQRNLWPANGGLNLKGTELVLLRERDDGRIPKALTLDKLVRLGPLQDAQRELGLRKP